MLDHDTEKGQEQACGISSLTSCQITDTNVDSHTRCTLVVTSEVDTQPGDVTRESRVDTCDGPISFCEFVGVN
jgi:hypothetical protein